MSVDQDPPSTPRRNRRSGRLRGWATNIILILVIVGGVQWWKARPLVSGNAPPLVGVALDGRMLDLAELQGRPVLVHFWASWCPVCTVMDGAVAAIARDHSVVTVALQSGGTDALREWMREAGHAFPVIADPDGQHASLWGVRGVPASFVIDAAGRIRYSTVGASTEPGLRLRLWAAGRGD